MKKDCIDALIIDDSPGDIRLTAELLKDSASQRYTLASAVRLDDGLEKMKERKFDVVLLDLNLPDCRYLEGLERITRRFPETPIILLTGLDDETVCVQALSKNAGDYLVKGQIDTAILTRSIRYTIERKRAEDMLRRSEETYRTLFNTLIEGFCTIEMVFDPCGKPVDYRFLEINPAFERQTGLHNAKGRLMSELAPDHEKHWFEIYGKIAITGESARFENEAKALGRYYEVFAWRIGGQESRKVAIIFNDITERKREEREREMTVQFLGLVNVSTGSRELVSLAADFFRVQFHIEAVGVRLKEGDDYPYFETRGFSKEFTQSENSLCSRDRKGEIQRDSAGNPVIACLCGNVICGRFDPSKEFFTQAGSFWTRSTTKLLATTTEKDLMTHLRNRCNNEGYESVALIALRAGGERIGLLQLNDKRPNRFTPELVALWERLCGYLAVAIAKTQAEEALASSRKLLQSIIDNTSHLIYVLDLEERFLIASKAVGDLLSVTPQQMIGKKRLQFMPKETADWHEANDKKVIDSAKALEFEEHGNFKGREITFLTVKFPLHDSKGRVYAVAGISSDISSRKEAEDILRRDKETFEKLVQERTSQLFDAQFELERAKRLSDIGMLATTVAHELRNPLATIGMATHNIKRKKNDPEIARHLSNIDKKVAESDQIINNLLYYSRLRTPQLEKVNVFEIIEECAELLEKQNKKLITLKKKYDSIRNSTVEADPLQLREVFNNILNNAQDAVSLKGGTIKINAEDEDGAIKVSVEDNGSGIEREMLDKIFDPFFTTKAKGTGLGLSVCKHIISMHEGKIAIESEPGRGTNVILYLPKKP